MAVPASDSTPAQRTVGSHIAGSDGSAPSVQSAQESPPTSPIDASIVDPNPRTTARIASAGKSIMSSSTMEPTAGLLFFEGDEDVIEDESVQDPYASLHVDDDNQQVVIRDHEGSISQRRNSHSVGSPPGGDPVKEVHQAAALVLSPKKSWKQYIMPAKLAAFFEKSEASKKAAQAKAQAAQKAEASSIVDKILKKPKATLNAKDKQKLREFFKSHPFEAASILDKKCTTMDQIKLILGKVGITMGRIDDEFSSFRAEVAAIEDKPESLDEEGPIQVGRPENVRDEDPIQNLLQQLMLGEKELHNLSENELSILKSNPGRFEYYRPRAESQAASIVDHILENHEEPLNPTDKQKLVIFLKIFPENGANLLASKCKDIVHLDIIAEKAGITEEDEDFQLLISELGSKHLPHDLSPQLLDIDQLIEGLKDGTAVIKNLSSDDIRTLERDPNRFEKFAELYNERPQLFMDLLPILQENEQRAIMKHIRANCDPKEEIDTAFAAAKDANIKISDVMQRLCLQDDDGNFSQASEVDKQMLAHYFEDLPTSGTGIDALFNLRDKEITRIFDILRGKDAAIAAAVSTKIMVQCYNDSSETFVTLLNALPKNEQRALMKHIREARLVNADTDQRLADAIDSSFDQQHINMQTVINGLITRNPITGDFVSVRPSDKQKLIEYFEAAEPSGLGKGFDELVALNAEEFDHVISLLKKEKGDVWGQRVADAVIRKTASLKQEFRELAAKDVLDPQDIAKLKQFASVLRELKESSNPADKRVYDSILAKLGDHPEVVNLVNQKGIRKQEILAKNESDKRIANAPKVFMELDELSDHRALGFINKLDKEMLAELAKPAYTAQLYELSKRDSNDHAVYKYLLSRMNVAAHPLAVAQPPGPVIQWDEETQKKFIALKGIPTTDATTPAQATNLVRAQGVKGDEDAGAGIVLQLCHPDNIAQLQALATSKPKVYDALLGQFKIALGRKGMNEEQASTMINHIKGIVNPLDAEKATVWSHGMAAYYKLTTTLTNTAENCKSAVNSLTPEELDGLFDPENTAILETLKANDDLYKELARRLTDPIHTPRLHALYKHKSDLFYVILEKIQKKMEEELGAQRDQAAGKINSIEKRVKAYGLLPQEDRTKQQAAWSEGMKAYGKFSAANTPEKIKAALTVEPPKDPNNNDQVEAYNEAIKDLDAMLDALFDPANASTLHRIKIENEKLFKAIIIKKRSRDGHQILEKIGNEKYDQLIGQGQSTIQAKETIRTLALPEQEKQKIRRRKVVKDATDYTE